MSAASSEFEFGSRRLRWPTKLGYGSAELGLVAVEVVIEIYLLRFYHTTVGLSAALTGLALAIAVIWDAFSDPIMGEISDHTRHRSGRRRPYLLPGAIALAGSFALIFNPPAFSSAATGFVYLLGSYLLLTTAMTVIGVPHVALGGELSFDRDERTEIFGYRRLFSTLGLLVGTLVPALLLRWAAGGEGGEGLAGEEAVARSRSVTSFVLAIPIVVTAWITFRSTRGLDRVHRIRAGASRLRLSSILRAQFQGLRDPIFIPLLLAFVIAGVGRAINASSALYYYEYKIGLRESDAVVYVLLPFFLCILASVPIWVRISRRFGKKWPAFAGMLGLGLSISVAYPILPYGSLSGPIGVAVVGGFFAGAIIIFESLIADVVDRDELRRGENREGLYFGLWKMSVKLSRAIGLALSGVLLQAIGLDEAGTVSDPSGVAEGIGWIFGPGVGGFFVLACLVFLCFPLTDRRHRRVQELLARRRLRRRAL